MSPLVTPCQLKPLRSLTISKDKLKALLSASEDEDDSELLQPIDSLIFGSKKSNEKRSEKEETVTKKKKLVKPLRGGKSPSISPAKRSSPVIEAPAARYIKR